MKRRRLPRLHQMPAALRTLRVLATSDWIWIIVVCLVAALVAFLAYFAVDAGRGRDQAALRSVSDQARLDDLQRREDALVAALGVAAKDRGRLQQAIDDLSAQIEQLGGTPVATAPRPAAPQPSGGGGPAATSAPRPSSGPTPRRTPTPPGTPVPQPTPTPTPSPTSTGVCLPIVGCI